MVKPETYTLRPKRSKDIEHASADVEVMKLERPAHGAWFASVNISLVFQLRDGRRVLVDKKLRLRGAQEGQRPNPNPFGRKKKK